MSLDRDASVWSAIRLDGTMRSPWGLYHSSLTGSPIARSKVRGKERKEKSTDYFSVNAERLREKAFPPPRVGVITVSLFIFYCHLTNQDKSKSELYFPFSYLHSFLTKESLMHPLAPGNCPKRHLYKWLLKYYRSWELSAALLFITCCFSLIC